MTAVKFDQSLSLSLFGRWLRPHPLPIRAPTVKESSSLFFLFPNKPTVHNPIDRKYSEAPSASGATMAAPPRKPIHEQPKLCDHILSRVSKSNVSLRIGLSPISKAGSGLFTVNDIPAGTEIFRTDPLITVSESAHRGICDFCFLNRDTSVNEQGRFYSSIVDDVRPEITRCGACRVARYCSKVRLAVPSDSPAADR